MEALALVPAAGAGLFLWEHNGLRAKQRGQASAPQGGSGLPKRP